MSRSVRLLLPAVTLALIALALACSDTSQPVNPIAPSFSNAGGNGHAYGHYKLAQCTTRHAREDSVVIDASGGVLQLGPNRLVVPAGALDQPTLLTGEVLPIDTANIEFGPEGLQFEVPAELTMNTGGCHIPAGSTPYIVYVIDGQITEVIPSTFDQVHNKITGPIHHFSGYAIAVGDDDQ